MQKASVVIGANWGDEGKGLMTDYLCRKKGADLVVRFNGGAQAGHTVVTKDGKRHVFSHIGSGYFAGVPTYLSEHFIINPILFRKEYEALGIPDDYKIYRHPKCLITTPWDMIANQIKETLRGNDRHGSCGAGINETVQREGTMLIEHVWGELADAQCFWEEYFESRILPDWAKDAYRRAADINEQFAEDLLFIYRHTSEAITPPFNYAIFEGAQGLALDQFMGNFPHVTRSNTGVRNVIDLQRRMGFELDEIVYVTRTYLTRHGADPNFIDHPFPPEVVDKTNIPNEWQGRLRYAPLDMSVKERIATDIRANGLGNLRLKVRLAMTHADQIPVSAHQFPPDYVSYGETAEDVKEK